MNFQNNRYTLRFADSNDSQGIREIYESGSFPGNLQIRFLRNPDPFSSLASEGYPRIMVVYDNQDNRYVAVGGAVIREEYVSGQAVKNAYLTGLKIHPDYQKKISFIKDSYKFLYDGLGEVAHSYTTILDDNKAVISMLEKKRKNMPVYNYLGHYETYCFHDGARKLPIKCVTEYNHLIKLIDDNNRAMSFVPTDINLPGLGDKKLYYYEADSEIEAYCFVCNQQADKQYELTRYDGIYKFLSHMPTKLMGYPAFPREGSLIDYGTVAFLYIKENNPKLCRNFLRSVAKASGYDLLLWGCFENNPLAAAMDKMKTIHYGSRLYEVDWTNYANSSVDKDTANTDKDASTTSNVLTTNHNEVNADNPTTPGSLSDYGTIGVEVALL